MRGKWKFGCLSIFFNKFWGMGMALLSQGAPEWVRLKNNSLFELRSQHSPTSATFAKGKLINREEKTTSIIVSPLKQPLKQNAHAL